MSDDESEKAGIHYKSMNSIVCAHLDAQKTGRACEHLLKRKEGAEYFSAQEHYRHFTGHGFEFVLLCPACRDLPNHGESSWRVICDSCVEDLGIGKRLGETGAPQILTRSPGLKLIHNVLSIPTSGVAATVAEPLGGNGSWLLVTAAGELMELNPSVLELRVITTVAQLGLAPDQPISIAVSHDDRFIAVTLKYGSDGVVFDRRNNRITMRLERGAYLTEHCKFPAAFFEDEKRPLLIHATDWNRLDISDPADGKLLTDRTPTSYQRGEQQPAHYLDYFQCGLAVSQDSEWVIANGWVWHPVGVITTWSVKRWLIANVWESEDGQSKRSLCWRNYYWDGPFCWIDNRTVAIWGIGEDDLLLIPGVRVIDVETGVEKLAFAGPAAERIKVQLTQNGKSTSVFENAGTLVFDQWLFSWVSNGEFSVWDINDGARVLVDPGFAPLSYHPQLKSFLSQQPDGTFQLSKLVQGDSSSLQV